MGGLLHRCMTYPVFCNTLASPLGPRPADSFGAHRARPRHQAIQCSNRDVRKQSSEFRGIVLRVPLDRSLVVRSTVRLVAGNLNSLMEHPSFIPAHRRHPRRTSWLRTRNNAPDWPACHTRRQHIAHLFLAKWLAFCGQPSSKETRNSSAEVHTAGNEYPKAQRTRLCKEWDPYRVECRSPIA